MEHAKYVTRPRTCPGNSQGGYTFNLCEPVRYHAVTVKTIKRILTTRENLFLHSIKMIVCCPAFKTSMTKIIFLFGQIFYFLFPFSKTWLSWSKAQNTIGNTGLKWIKTQRASKGFAPYMLKTCVPLLQYVERYVFTTNTSLLLSLVKSRTKDFAIKAICCFYHSQKQQKLRVTALFMRQ